MDYKREKSELQAEKTAIEAAITTLGTKAGAESFIADEIRTLDAAIAQLPDRKVGQNQISMRTFLSDIKKMIEAKPEKEVARHITRLEGEVATIEQELKAIDDTEGGVRRES